MISPEINGIVVVDKPDGMSSACLLYTSDAADEN